MTDLQLLIAELERQRDELEEEIQECIMVRDFMAAAMHQEVLDHVKRRLTVARHIDDPDYGAKVRLRRYPGAMQALAEKRLKRLNLSPEDEAVYLEKHFEFSHRKNPELAALEAKPKHFHVDGDEIWTRLEQLLDGTLPEVSIVFHPSGTRVVVHLSCLSSEVCISISKDGPDEFYGMMFSEGMYQLRAMGFDVDDDSAVKTLRDPAEATPQNILTLLARVAFDVFEWTRDTPAELRLGSLVDGRVDGR